MRGDCFILIRLNQTSFRSVVYLFIMLAKISMSLFYIQKLKSSFKDANSQQKRTSGRDFRQSIRIYILHYAKICWFFTVKLVAEADNAFFS